MGIKPIDDSAVARVQRLKTLIEKFPEQKAELISKYLRVQTGDDGSATGEKKIEFTDQQKADIRLIIAADLYLTGKINPLEAAQITELWKRGEPLDEQGQRIAKKYGIILNDGDLTGNREAPSAERVERGLSSRLK